MYWEKSRNCSGLQWEYKDFASRDMANLKMQKEPLNEKFNLILVVKANAKQMIDQLNEKYLAIVDWLYIFQNKTKTTNKKT